MGGGLLLPTSPFSLLKTTAWSLAPSQLIFGSSEGRLREQQPPWLGWNGTDGADGLSAPSVPSVHFFCLLNPLVFR